MTTGEINREYGRLWRLAFPEKERAYNHSEKGKIARRDYRQSEKGKTARRHYWQSEKGKTTRLQHNQSENGKLLCQQGAARHRARKLGLTVKGWNFEINAFYTRAQELRDAFLYVSVDHIIPLAEGGLHAPWNLQIILHHENREKGDRPGYEPSVIFA